MAGNTNQNSINMNEHAVSPDELNKLEDADASDLRVVESEEASKSVGLRVENKPTPEEVANHELTHLPFRSWCKHCVFGRAKADFHKRVEREKNEVPKISWEYMYMRENHEGVRPEVVEGDGVPILVSKDSE